MCLLFQVVQLLNTIIDNENIRSVDLVMYLGLIVGICGGWQGGGSPLRAVSEVTKQGGGSSEKIISEKSIAYKSF